MDAWLREYVSDEDFVKWAYWRNHTKLNAWMQGVENASIDRDGSTRVDLDTDDLRRLYSDIISGRLDPSRRRGDIYFLERILSSSVQRLRYVSIAS